MPVPPASQSGGAGLRERRFDGLTVAVIALCVLSIWELKLALIYDSTDPFSAGQAAQPYFGNLTLGDFALVILSGWLGTLPEFRAFVRGFVRTWIGFVSAAFVLFVVALAPFSTEQALAYNLKQAAQFAANVGLVVPTIAFLIARSHDLFVILGRLTVFYVLVVWFGAFLYFVLGRQDVFRLYGDSRLLPNLGQDALQYCVLGYCGVSLLTARGWAAKFLALAGVATFMLSAVIAASRTMFVSMIAVAVAPLIFSTLLRGRSLFLYVLISVPAAIALYQYMFVGFSDASTIMVRYDGFADFERTFLITDGLRRVTESAPAMLFGLGWDLSGIHNLAIQAFVDGGFFVAATLVVLVLSPFWTFWKCRRSAPIDCLLGTGILVGFVLAYSLNALPTLRVYWIPFGMVIGLAMRARNASRVRMRL